jgi:hypothetical protein
MIGAMSIGGPALLAATVHAFLVGAVAFPFGLPEEVQKGASPGWALAACISGWIGVFGILLALACAAYCQFIRREIGDADFPS